MSLTEPQKKVATSNSRFRVLITGRRFGKTYLAIRELCRFARFPKQTVWYVAPSYRMSKTIVWDELKNRLRPLRWIKKINEADLTIELINGSKIQLRGADNEDALRGIGLNFLCMDEFADIDPKAWYEVLRPTLSDRKGHVLFCGTPRGKSNWSHDLYEYAATDKSWSRHQYTTIQGQQVSKEEIEQAKNDLDPRIFRQEYEASFETFAGSIYYNWDAETHVVEEPVENKQVLHIGIDFNIDPMSAAVAVEKNDGLYIFDEMNIPSSNTQELVDEIKSRYPTSTIIAYPDPASKQRKTSAGGKTDLSILQNAGFRVLLRHSHPQIRDRINAVNSLLKNTNNKSRLQVHRNCKNVIKSLSSHTYKQGTQQPETNGLEHMADALGYMIEFKYPIKISINNSGNTPKQWNVRTKGFLNG